MNRPLFHSAKAKCKAIGNEYDFYSHANKIHFRKKSFKLGLVLKVKVFGTKKWPTIEQKRLVLEQPPAQLVYCQTQKQRDHLKDFRNVDCVLANYNNVQDTQGNLKTTN